ncbi:ABC transporter substrate-binding protein [Tenacibaculum sp. SG-28]|uniref:ABC transporter substrate-binding protein n=1 Tax=Tenacibaculum sp. SG-28 TaxID=754426 RepID=UPI000CF3C4DA|nr:ABC transporter substrate-binding protein [Tenacibaculum sp. SG-28]PQJ19904.1 ABC transporter substrate-binding protein [Tenacibaculum sp. SG-28]
MDKLSVLKQILKPVLYALCISASIVIFGCNSTVKEINKTKETTSKTIKYAKGFDIITTDNKKQLVVHRAFQNSKESITYTVNETGSMEPGEISVPAQKIVVTSTTHIPMLELLGAENTLVGFPHTKYISSEKTQARIAAGKIVDLGMEQDINTEKLMALQPDLVVGFSLQSNNRLYENISKAQIPILFNGDWLEETPLGRAEWIKFFGVLLGKEKEADSIFNTIEKNYLNAKKVAKRNSITPKVMSGSMFKDVWNVPAGKSFIATFFKDANLNYVWKDTDGTGSLQLSFESVLEKGKDAEYWINCGIYETKEQLLAANINYAEFEAFQQNQLFTIAKKRGKTGGLIFYELSPVRPDLVLQDFIKITTPTALPDYELTFFSKLD